MRATARQPANTAELDTTVSTGVSQQTDATSTLASEHEKMYSNMLAMELQIECGQAADHEVAADPDPISGGPSSPTQRVRKHVQLETDPEENIWDDDTCLLCPKTFANVGGRTKHYRMTHNAYKPYECDACGDKFCQLFQLKRHITLHTNLASSTTFDCKRCYMVFFVEDNLTRHQCTFRKDLWKCPECGTDVPDQDFDDVLAHIRAHITK